MAENTDWLPRARGEQLAMCRNWLTVMTEEARAAWGIPQAQYTELEDLCAAAAVLLEKAQSSDRTESVTWQCRGSFNALGKKQRFFKNHYLLSPPLDNAALVRLGLSPRPAHYARTGKPAAMAAVETFLAGRHELGIRLVYVSGNPEDRANKGFRVWYKAVPPGGAPVTHPRELSESFFTRRKKDLIVFDYEDSGKTAFIAVQVENGSKKGPWGPIVSSIIP
jgi:hypothetical protein